MFFGESALGKVTWKTPSTKITERPTVRLHVDHLGPFWYRNKGNMYILPIVDAFSRFLNFFATRTTSAMKTIAKVEEFVNHFRTSTETISDLRLLITSFVAFAENHRTLTDCCTISPGKWNGGNSKEIYSFHKSDYRRLLK